MVIWSYVTSASVPYWDGGWVLLEIVDGNGYIRARSREWPWKRSARRVVSGEPIFLYASLVHASLR